MATPADILGQYIATYRYAIDLTRYSDLETLQPPPFATVAHGGSGTAIALARLAEKQSDPKVRLMARRWSASARADSRRRAFDRDGYFVGKVGVDLALVQNGRSIQRAARRLVGGPREVLAGTAGALIGASLIRRTHDGAAASKAASVLAADVEAAVRRRARKEWRDGDAIGFAHGWPGLLYALLLHRETTGAGVESWLVDTLARLARAWQPARAKYPQLLASWCGGDAGAAILWCKTFEVVGDLRFRRAAIAAARAAMRTEPAKTHICCGKGAVAYALLSVDRIQPGYGWRERAVEVGARAVATPLVSRWPNGLLWGHPGLVCLALDLMSEKPRGFPLIEG
jgi:hypothetical protein